MDPKVCVIIVTWNKKQYVLDLLQSLKKQEYQPFDVIVVDNHSSDKTVEAIQESFPEVHVIANQTNLGSTGGWNTGLRHMLKKDDYKYAWVMDNDVIAEPKSLYYLVETLEKNPDASLCGSKIIKMNTDNIQECGAYIDWKSCQVKLFRDGEVDTKNHAPHVVEVDYCAACSILVRIEDIRGYGIMDEEFFLFYDDVEWSTRFKQSGRKILCDQRSRVSHFFHGDKPLVPVRLYYSIRNRLYFFSHYCPIYKKKKVMGSLISKFLELSTYMQTLGYQNLATAILLSLEDFLNNVRGKWQHQDTFVGQKNLEKDISKFQAIAQNTSFMLIQLNKPYDLSFIPFKKHTSYIWHESQTSRFRKIILCLNMLCCQSVFVGFKPIPQMLLSAYCLYPDGDTWLVKKNDRLNNIMTLMKGRLTTILHTWMSSFRSESFWKAYLRRMRDSE